MSTAIARPGAVEIPGYTVQRLIGRGGMSSVYLAVQRSLGRRVALKVMKRFDDARQTNRFLHEGRIIAALNHRNIITIHDIGTIGERHYIAMEYLRGQSLAERIEKGMPVAKVLLLLEHLAACLHFVHKRGIIHRDIKPSNIMFHGDGTPKLTDFGIAKRIHSNQELTLQGSALGSPYYLSPEQAEGRNVDGRTDIYALGIVFYEMLTGERPYAREQPMETVLAHLTAPLPVLPPHLAGYQGLLEAMIAKRPADRVGSAKELVHLVRAARSPAGGGPRAASPGQQSTQYVRPRYRLNLHHVQAPRRRMTPWFTLAVVAVVLGGGVMLGSAGDPEIGPEAPATDAPPDPTGPVVMPAGDDSAHREPPQRLAGSSTEPDARPEAPLTVPSRSGDNEAGPTLPEPGRPPPGVAAMGGDGPAAVPGVRDPEESPPPIESRVAAAGPIAPPDPPPRSTEVASIDPTPMVTPGQPSTTGRVIQLMLAANAAMDELRLTLPRDDNALRHYREVLALSPGHAGAQAGIAAIADRYADMAERALQRGTNGTAASYVRRGLGVRSEHGRLQELQRAVARARLAEQAATSEPGAAKEPEPVEVRPSEPESIIGKPGTGDIVGDFKRVWRAVFD